MTRRLYDSDAFLWQTGATVTACREAENGFAVCLDQTVFFPQGGGQPGDVGTLNDCPVTDTREEDGVLWHFCPVSFAVGQSVVAHVDEERRFDRMQQHTGEHILSYAFWHLFDHTNIGFHLNDSFATMDLNAAVTDEELTRAETLANQIVFENRRVTAYTADLSSVDPARLRKDSGKGGDRPRLVEIEGADLCTCCAPHVAFTGQVGLIKIVKKEKAHGGTRLTFLCGGRALRDYAHKSDVIQNLTAALSTDADNLSRRFADLSAQSAEAHRRLRNLSQKLLTVQAGELLAARGDSAWVLACMEDASEEEVKTMLNLLLEQPVTALVVAQVGERLQFMCAAAPQSPVKSCRSACELLCGILSGKGGGSDTLARGGAPVSADWQTHAASVLQVLRKSEVR